MRVQGPPGSWWEVWRAKPSGLALRTAHWLADALLPPHCLTCDAAVVQQGTQCVACFADLAFITAPLCARCGLPFAEAGRHRLPGLHRHATGLRGGPRRLLYTEGARRLILPLKHGGRTELALPLARHMLRAGRGLLAEAELLCRCRPTPAPARPPLRPGGLARPPTRRGSRACPGAPRLLRRGAAHAQPRPTGAAGRRAALVAGAFAAARAAAPPPRRAAHAAGG